MGELTAEVDVFVDEHWSEDVQLGDWWEALAAAGFAFPSWPTELGGRSLGASGGREVVGALAARGVIGPPSGVGQTMGAPTILAHGSPEQRQRWVPELAAGREAWCQLFSEPGAGSDLASLQTRARRDGDLFRVSGQKVWNSGADIADRGLLLARTDVDVPKHDGISYFVVDMNQPGVSVRPLRQMNGDAEFSEVFLDDVVVSTADLVGELGDGWRITRTTLGFERANIGAGAVRGLVSVAPGRRAGNLGRPVGELVALARKRTSKGGYVLSARELIALARKRSLDTDPLVRQRLAHLHTLIELNRLTAQRARVRAKAGKPGPETSIGKLALANIARESRDLGLHLAGADGMLVGADAPDGGRLSHVALSSFATSIGGGTDEIQRNVIGERALGLPKEPQIDSGVPFRDLRVATVDGVGA